MDSAKDVFVLCPVVCVNHPLNPKRDIEENLNTVNPENPEDWERFGQEVSQTIKRYGIGSRYQIEFRGEWI
jgi:hypothetical protein